MGKKIFQNVLTFVVIFLVVQLIFSFFTKKDANEEVKKGEISITTGEKEYPKGKLVELNIQNNTDKEITFPVECPEEPFTVLEYIGGEWKKKTSKPEIKCSEIKTFAIKASDKAVITYENWNRALFGELGRYKIEGTFKIGTGDEATEKTIASNEFEVVQEGVFRFLWMKGFYQPIYNVLMFFVGIMPGHNLGLAIILLTIFIRLVLLIPSQKGLKSQRRMQEIQPKLNEIKEKHAGNQQKIAEETMKLWKENKVNPFGSCLPLLIQLPILIALFYVVQTGLNPDNEYLLYGGFINFSLSDINVMLTPYLDLTQRNTLWLPLVVGLLQFIQMKMSFMKKAPNAKKSDTEMVNNTMLYFMPVMIAVFTASVPAGVGIYWLTSTLFGIVQQYFVNKPANSTKPVIIEQ